MNGSSPQRSSPQGSGLRARGEAPLSGWRGAVQRASEDPQLGLISLFAALIAAVAAFFCFAGLNGLRLAARHRALLAAINRSDAQPWRLVETEVEMPDANSMKIPASADSNSAKVHATFNKTDAWVLRLTDKTARILAVAPRTGGIPIPIDMAFECFKDLTDDEKNKLRQIVNQHVNANTTINTGTHADTFGTTL